MGVYGIHREAVVLLFDAMVVNRQIIVNSGHLNFPKAQFDLFKHPFLIQHADQNPKKRKKQQI